MAGRLNPTFFVNVKSMKSFGSQQLLDLVDAELRRKWAAK